jgi:hypothetical protein
VLSPPVPDSTAANLGRLTPNVNEVSPGAKQKVALDCSLPDSVRGFHAMDPVDTPLRTITLRVLSSSAVVSLAGHEAEAV